MNESLQDFTPSETAGNGRGPGGRFGQGNRFAKGNAQARKMARFRAEVLRAVSPEDLRGVVVALIEAAKKGEVSAIKELFDRLMGRPVELDMIERLERL